MRTEFPVPDEVQIDAESGYAINLPLGPQDYPGWQQDRPEVVRRIIALRKELGVVVEDDGFVEKPQVQGRQQVTKRTGAQKAPLPKRRRS